MVNKSVCCVKRCKNSGRNHCYQFYIFPRSQFKLEQRKKWIDAVRKMNGADWVPNLHDKICSAHFIGNKKSEIQLSPSYVPTIFTSTLNTKFMDEHYQETVLNRHQRWVDRRFSKEPSKISVVYRDKEIQESMGTSDEEMYFSLFENSSKDVECEVNFIEEEASVQESFSCNRYIYRDSEKCDAEVQTNIAKNIKIKKTINRRQFQDKQCETIQKTFEDSSVQCDLTIELKPKSFSGFSSVKTKAQLRDIAGVSFKHFNFLLKGLRQAKDHNNHAKNNLLIFLIKIKTGLTFSGMSVFFSLHRTTISRIFHSVLTHLVKVTQELVFWPDKYCVRATMPECFLQEYGDTRVIIDCTEFRIEMPSEVGKKVYCYSHYKKGFTAKVLIGISPGGFISFKSKVSGGRKSDSQLTVESGLIDLLEEGDIVLADKGFPEIKNVIDDRGKKAIIVMPPFLQSKKEFTQKETEDTYNIARVRIHVERIMQRLRTYQILNKIPENLFSSIDDILHMCCVLVNMQPPIISDNSNQNKPVNK